ncbi:MAG: beta-galactosidase [Anaerolinea sp.]|nr:beta-galactosidase [Anaerolinea sp.]
MASINVRVADKRIWVGDEGRALLSGEVHYWRLPPSAWLPVLQQIKALGLRVISTYVCWEFHEVAPGEYDFDGRTDAARNLLHFLDLVQSEGLWLIARPGPYIYAEWVNNGVPARVAHLHRLHPDFVTAARAYLTAVLGALTPYFAVNGGAVVLLQVDNEPDAWATFYARSLGLAGEPGVFQAYLREAYDGDLNRLNANWESSLTDFDHAQAVTTPAILERAYVNRYLDYRRFLYWYSAEIVRWTAEHFRAHAPGMPLLINHYPHHLAQNWRVLEAYGDVSGIDYYSHNEFTRDDWEHGEFLHLLRYTRSYAALPFIAEFQAGIWHGWHSISGILTARHYQLAAVSALLAGVAGWNWYMLVNRDNWYMSPFNEWGRARPELIVTFQRLVKLFEEIDPPSLIKLTETALALDVLDRSSEIGGFDDPVRTACYQADVDYECFDMATGTLRKPLLLYSGHRWMEEASQRRLLDYVEAGGNLVFFDQLPVYDAQMNRLNLLGLREPEGILSGAHLTIWLGDQPCEVSVPRHFLYDRVPGEPIHSFRRLDSGYNAEEQRLHFGLPMGTQTVIGYRERRGSGSITVLGVPPTSSLVTALHRWFDVPLYSHVSLAGVSSALFQRDEVFYVIVANNRADPVDALIELHRPAFAAARYEVRDLWTGAADRVDLAINAVVRAQLPAKSGTVLRLNHLDEVTIR